MLAFLLATSQAKALTLNETLDLHINLDGEKRNGVDRLNKARRKDFIVNKYEENNDQALIYGTNGDKYT